jgi:hypothetical protein
VPLPRVRPGRHRQRPPHRRRRGRRHQGGDQVGDRLGQPGGALQQTPDPRGGHRGEELLEVHAEDDGTAGVRRGRRAHRPAGDAAVGGVVHRDRGEHVPQQPPLGLLEPRLGCGEQPQPAAALDRVPAVVAQRFVDRALQAADVGEPGELGLVEVQQPGERGGVRQRGDAEAVARHRGGHRLPADDAARGAGALPALRGRDEQGQLPRPVDRRRDVRGEHLVDRADPARRPREAEGDGDPADHRPPRPRPGQQRRGGARGREGGPGADRHRRARRGRQPLLEGVAMSCAERSWWRLTPCPARCVAPGLPRGDRLTPVVLPSPPRTAPP